MDTGSINWEFWRTFLAVVAEGSLSGAARHLGLTQPTVGRHISGLEESLGVSLFSRAQNGLTPTDLALTLVPHAEAMAGSAAALVRTASGDPGQDEGTVRLSASEIVGVEILPRMLAQFCRLHPRIRIELVVSNRNTDLLRRDADIALRMVQPMQDALVARRLGTATLGLYAHALYPSFRDLPVRLEDLFDHPLIGADQDISRMAGFEIGGRKVDRSLFTFRCDSDVAQLAMLRAGLGIGVCHDRIASRDGDLVAVLPDHVRFAFDFWAVMHEDLRGSRRVRLLYDYLVNGLSKYLEAGPGASDRRPASPAGRTP